MSQLTPKVLSITHSLVEQCVMCKENFSYSKLVQCQYCSNNLCHMDFKQSCAIVKEDELSFKDSYTCEKCYNLKDFAEDLHIAEIKIIVRGIHKLINFQTHIIRDALSLYTIPNTLTDIISKYAIEEYAIEEYDIEFD